MPAAGGLAWASGMRLYAVLFTAGALLAASFGEEALVATGLYTAFQHPVVFLVLLGLFVVLLIWLLPKVFRGVRLVFGRFF